MAGSGFTVTVTMALFVQVVTGLVAVTVYTCVAGVVPVFTGFTTAVFVEIAPGFHIQLIDEDTFVPTIPLNTITGLLGLLDVPAVCAQAPVISVYMDVLATEAISTEEDPELVAS